MEAAVPLRDAFMIRRAAVLLLAAVAACRNGNGGSQRVRRCPAPGGGSPAAIEVAPSTVRSAEPWSVEEDLSLGRAFGDSALEFGFITDITQGPWGRIYLADAQALRVSVHDSTGSLVRTLGREGEGPGEFSGPMRLSRRPDDSVRVFDLALWRETVFDTTGRHAGTTTLPQRPRFGQIPAVEYDGEGGIYNLGYGEFRESLLESLGGQVEGVGRGRLTLDRWQRNRGEWITLARVPSIRVYFSGGGLRDAPFAPRPLWDAASGGVWYADSRHYRLTRLSAAGDTVCRVHVDAEPPRVSRGDRDAYLEGDDLADLPDDRRRRVLQRRREMPIPDHRPVLEELVAAPGGGMWVRPSPETWNAPPDTVAWHVFSGRGEPVARVRLPRGFHPMRVQPDAVLGVRETDTGVDQVVRYAVIRGG